MKKILLGLIVLGAMASCKKSHDNPVCEVSVAGIAASYKLTKVVNVSGTTDVDVTSTYQQAYPCDFNGVYQLKVDKSVIYTETGTCSGSGTGTWDVVNNTITITTNSSGSIDFSAAAVSSWDCGTLVIADTFTSGGTTTTTKYSFTKQ